MLTSDDFCIVCLKNAAENAVNAVDYKEKRALLRNLAEVALAGDCLGGTAYYVSRPWYSFLFILHVRCFSSRSIARHVSIFN